MTRDEAPGPRGIVGCLQVVEKLDLINTGTLGWCAVWFFLPLEAKLFPAACAAGNNFMQVWTNLCYSECFCKTKASSPT